MVAGGGVRWGEVASATSIGRFLVHTVLGRGVGDERSDAEGLGHERRTSVRTATSMTTVYEASTLGRVTEGGSRLD